MKNDNVDVQSGSSWFAFVVSLLTVSVLRNTAQSQAELFMETVEVHYPSPYPHLKKGNEDAINDFPVLKLNEVTMVMMYKVKFTYKARKKPLS